MQIGQSQEIVIGEGQDCWKLAGKRETDKIVCPPDSREYGTRQNLDIPDAPLTLDQKIQRIVNKQRGIKQDRPQATYEYQVIAETSGIMNHIDIEITFNGQSLFIYEATYRPDIKIARQVAIRNILKKAREDGYSNLKEKTPV